MDLEVRGSSLTLLRTSPHLTPLQWGDHQGHAPHGVLRPSPSKSTTNWCVTISGQQPTNVMTAEITSTAPFMAGIVMDRTNITAGCAGTGT